MKEREREREREEEEEETLADRDHFSSSVFFRFFKLETEQLNCLCACVLFCKKKKTNQT